MSDRKYSSWDKESSSCGYGKSNFSVVKGKLNSSSKELFSETPMFASEGWPVFVALDGTGSMGMWVSEIKENLKTLFDDSKEVIPNAYFSFAIINDFCDGDNSCVQVSPFGCGCELVHFIDSLRGGHGGDEPEAYEVYAKYVLDAVNNQPAMIYKPIVIIIGDAFPHGIDGYSGSRIAKYNFDVPKLFQELAKKTHLVVIGAGGKDYNMDSLMQTTEGKSTSVDRPSQIVKKCVDEIGAIMKKEGLFNKDLVPKQPKKKKLNMKKRLKNFG